jgi:thymidylate kinase
MIPPPHSAMAPYIASCDPLTQLTFFLTGVRGAAATVNNRLTSSAVVSDRWVNSVLANHSAVNGVSLADVQTLAGPFLEEVPKPDLTIYLEAGEATLRARMAGKPDLSSSDLALLNKPGLLAHVIALYDQLADADPTAVRLDCNDLDADAVFDQALKPWEAHSAEPH